MDIRAASLRGTRAQGPCHGSSRQHVSARLDTQRTLCFTSRAHSWGFVVTSTEPDQPGQTPNWTPPTGQGLGDGTAWPPPPPPPKPRTRVSVWAWVVMGVLALAVIGVSVGTTSSKTKAVAGPVITQTATATVTPPAPTATVTHTQKVKVPVPGPTKVVTKQVPQTYTTLSDGTYVVGTDIQPGIYKTAGPGSSGVLNSCYWAVLTSLNTQDIADNGNISGPTTIQVSGRALELNGGCTWARIG